MCTCAPPIPSYPDSPILTLDFALRPSYNMIASMVRNAFRGHGIRLKVCGMSLFRSGRVTPFCHAKSLESSIRYTENL